MCVMNDGPTREFFKSIYLRKWTMHSVERLCQLVLCMLLQAVHPLRHMDKCQVFGKGKMEELTHQIRHRRKDVTAVVLGIDMLTALQLATLQDLWGVAVYDRCHLVSCQLCVILALILPLLLLLLLL